MTTATRTQDHEALTAASTAFRDLAATPGTLDPDTLRWVAERLDSWASESNPARTINRLNRRARDEAARTRDRLIAEEWREDRP